MNPRRVIVIVCRVGEQPRLTEIDATLKAQQELVGGLIEPVAIAQSLDVMINEEGLLLDLPFNRTIRAWNGREYYGQEIVGDFYVGRWNQDGELVSLVLRDFPVIVEALQI